MGGYGIGIFRVLQPGERKTAWSPTVKAACLQEHSSS